jgi:hypothetical protein
MIMAQQEIHIGELICRKLQEQARSKAWLAKQVHRNASSLCKILKHSHIDLELLLCISLILHYNFFDDCSKNFKANNAAKQSKTDCETDCC